MSISNSIGPVAISDSSGESEAIVLRPDLEFGLDLGGVLRLGGKAGFGLMSGWSLSDVTLGAVLHAGGSGQWRSTAGPNGQRRNEALVSGAAPAGSMVDPRRGKARTGWVSRSEDRKPNQGESLLGGAAEPIFRHTREGGCPCFGGLGVLGSDRGASPGGRCCRRLSGFPPLWE